MRSLAGIPAKNVVNESKNAKYAENRISEIHERIAKEGIAKECICENPRRRKTCRGGSVIFEKVSDDIGSYS